jgi:hypothetical protein
MTKYRTIKSGLSTARKYPDRPMKDNDEPKLKPHHVRHPNDKNIPRKDKGINWAKKGAKKTKREKKLEEFYKTHVYTWVSETSRAWVAIPSTEEEE